MRYISKHEADVYLDKEGKTHEWTEEGEKGLNSGSFLQMSSSDCAAMEPIPVLAQCCGMVQCLFYFSLFLIKKNPEATFLTTNGQK